MTKNIKDRIDNQVNNRYDTLEMLLCLGSFLLIPILMLGILPLFPLHGIEEHAQIIGLVVLCIGMYFGIGIKIIFKHIDSYYKKLFFTEISEQNLSNIEPTKFETRYRKSKNKIYAKYGYNAYIDLKTNNVYLTKTKMSLNKYFHVLDLEETDTKGRKLFLAQETVKETKNPNAILPIFPQLPKTKNKKNISHNQKEEVF